MINGTRLQYLQRMCRSYKPTIPSDFVLKELGFDLTMYHVRHNGHKSNHKHSSNHEHDSSKSVGLEFLKKAGCVITLIESSVDEIALTSDEASIEESWEINTKDSVIDFSAVFTQDKLLL